MSILHFISHGKGTPIRNAVRNTSLSIILTDFGLADIYRGRGFRQSACGYVGKMSDVTLNSAPLNG